MVSPVFNVLRSDGTTVWWHLSREEADQKSEWLNKNMQLSYSVVESVPGDLDRHYAGSPLPAADREVEGDR